MMIDCLRRYEKAIADFSIAQALGHEGENLELPVGEAGRVLFGTRPRATRDTSDTGVAQRLAQSFESRTGAEFFQNFNGREFGGFIAVGQRHCLFVRTADLSPGGGGSAPVSCYLQRVGRGDSFSGLNHAASPQPQSELALQPETSAAFGQVQKRTRFADNLFS